MTVKETLGRYYTLEYILSHLTNRWEEDGANLLKIKVLQEVEHTLRDMFYLLQPLFQEWITFHTTNIVYLSYIIYCSGKQYTYVSGVDSFIDEMVKGDSAVCRHCATTRWNTGKQFEESRLQATVFGALTDYGQRRHNDIWEDRSYCREVAALETQAWGIHVQERIMEAYWEFLDSLQVWEAMSVGERLAAASILLNMAHHSGRMLDALTHQGIDKEYLNSLSTLGDRLPMTPSVSFLKDMYMGV